jgi:hypothetical protein
LRFVYRISHEEDEFLEGEPQTVLYFEARREIEGEACCALWHVTRKVNVGSAFSIFSSLLETAWI